MAELLWFASGKSKSSNYHKRLFEVDPSQMSSLNMEEATQDSGLMNTEPETPEVMQL